MLAAITMITKHEHRLGVAQALKIVRGRIRARLRNVKQDKHERPETEYNLDLAEQVPNAGVRGLQARQVLEIFGQERGATATANNTVPTISIGVGGHVTRLGFGAPE